MVPVNRKRMTTRGGILSLKVVSQKAYNWVIVIILHSSSVTTSSVLYKMIAVFIIIMQKKITWSFESKHMESSLYGQNSIL